MDTLVPALRRHFDTLSDRYECFSRAEVQLEGWFKGELLFALDSLRATGLLRRVDREVKHGAGRIDIVVDLAPERHWIELKHWLIGSQKGVLYGPSFYFGDQTLGVVPDIDKLVKIESPARLWLLLLLTQNPGDAAWDSGLRKFHEKFGPRRLRCVTRPSGFPPSYYLGLLEVGR